MYAFIGYNLAYFINIMWFDAVLLLPIVVLGIEQLKNKKYYTYIIALTLSIISNFYIGFSVCIFSALYMLYDFFRVSKKERQETFSKNFIRFLTCSLIAVRLINVCNFANDKYIT